MPFRLNKLSHALRWAHIFLCGSIGNSILGSFTGLVGSLILQRNRPTTIAISWIGCVAGLIGGLLHATIVLFLERKTFFKGQPLQPNIKSFKTLSLLIFTHAPSWSAIGATSSYLMMVGNPTDSSNPLVSKLPFGMVILTALSGTLGLAIYAIIMCRFTGSSSHLFILQNLIILMAQDLITSESESLPLNPDQNLIQLTPPLIIFEEEKIQISCS